MHHISIHSNILKTIITLTTDTELWQRKDIEIFLINKKFSVLPILQIKSK